MAYCGLQPLTAGAVSGSEWISPDESLDLQANSSFLLTGRNKDKRDGQTTPSRTWQPVSLLAVSLWLSLTVMISAPARRGPASRSLTNGPRWGACHRMVHSSSGLAQQDSK